MRPLSRFRFRMRPVACTALALGALMATAAPMHGTAAVVTGSSRIVDLQIAGPTLGASRTAVVYLPAGYDNSANAGKRYPVLYLLSGAPGGPADWFRYGHAERTADRLIAAGTIAPLIIVSPDGNGGPRHDTQFVDSFDGRERVESFLTHDLLDAIDTRYRTVRSAAGRGLAGFSAGAFGALNVGLHHPDTFGTMGGFSGYYTADRRELILHNQSDPFGSGETALRRNSPSLTAATLRPRQAPHIFLFDSTVDGRYTRATRRFDAQLTRLGIAHVTRLYAPRTAVQRRIWPHAWFFVAYAFADSLPAIARDLQGGSV